MDNLQPVIFEVFMPQHGCFASKAFGTLPHVPREGEKVTLLLKDATAPRLVVTRVEHFWWHEPVRVEPFTVTNYVKVAIDGADLTWKGWRETFQLNGWEINPY